MKIKYFSILASIFFFLSAFTVAEQGAPVCLEESDYHLEADRSLTVLAAMSRDGVTQRRRPVGFGLPSSVDRSLLIEYLTDDQNQKFNYGSNLVPLVIALHETGFRNLRGDHHLGNGIGVSCGLTQIRTDFPGRPSCRTLLGEPMKALEWTANHLNRLYASRECVDNGRCLSRYAGAGPKARKFESWVTGTAHYVELHVDEELEHNECLPILV